MALEILNPELIQRVQVRIQTGHFHSADEVIEKALDALDASTPPALPGGPIRTGTGQDLVDASARLRGLFTDEEIDTMFARNRSEGRTVNFE